jgi:hypothetical protein
MDLQACQTRRRARADAHFRRNALYGSVVP